MQDSNVPVKFSVIWGADATGGFITTPIPVTSADPTRASLDLGFPPDTATPVGAGGTPPNVKDYNGAFNMLSAWAQWQAAGGPIYYDSAFSSAIGGYPKGALLSNASTVGAFWISTVDNNTSDPDTGGANWTAITLTGLVPTTRQIIAGTGLNGGGDLSANRTLNVTFGTGAGTAAQGNDARIVNAAQVNTGNTFAASQALSGTGAIGWNVTTNSAGGTAAYEATNDVGNLTEMVQFGSTAAGTSFGVANGNLGLLLALNHLAIGTAVSGGNMVLGTNNTAQLLFTSGGGVSDPGVSGGDKGAHTLNFTTIYQNGDAISSLFDAAGAAAIAQSSAEAFATAADSVVLSTAESFASALPGRLLGIAKFNSHGTFTYTTPGAATEIEPDIGAAGGGGAGATVTASAHVPNCGSGGGSGARTSGTISSPSSSYSVVIGQGGVHGSTGGNGSSGGNSTFGSAILVVTGGGGGLNGNAPGTGFQGDSAQGGARGTVSTAGNLLNISGNPGGPGLSQNRGFSKGGDGAPGPWGGGSGQGGNVTSDSDGSQDGTSAAGPGAGGGGGAVYSNANAHTANGGDGADGYAEVRAYT